MKKTSAKLASVAVIILVALLIISFSVTLPILFRPFFYMQINSLNLVNDTGLSVEEIKLAYNEMMDFCLGLRSDFSAGGLPFSEEGASHFYDVRVLFFLDFAILIVSAIVLAVIAILVKKKKLSLYRFFGRSAPFWSVISIFSVSALIGIACAINFEETFIFFHKIFFIGKTNWTFYPSTDPIINILPNQFFSNCAVLIFASILISCAAIIVYEIASSRKNKRSS